MDKIKAFGFHYTTRSGVTWGIDEVVIPKENQKLLLELRLRLTKLFLSSVKVLFLKKNDFERVLKSGMQQRTKSKKKFIPDTLDKNGSLYDMVYSGARGSFSQITQMGGMKGLIQNTAGETNEFPILSSTKEGLTPIEYFITTHGSRKGLTDTALNTAKAGYLTDDSLMLHKT